MTFLIEKGSIPMAFLVPVTITGLKGNIDEEILKIVKKLKQSMDKS